MKELNISQLEKTVGGMDCESALGLSAGLAISSIALMAVATPLALFVGLGLMYGGGFNAMYECIFS